MDDASQLRAALEAIHAARLTREGSDRGYGWNITKLNRAMNAALPLIGRVVPELDPRTAYIAESADRMAGFMGCRFTLYDTPAALPVDIGEEGK